MDCHGDALRRMALLVCMTEREHDSCLSALALFQLHIQFMRKRTVIVHGHRAR